MLSISSEHRLWSLLLCLQVTSAVLVAPGSVTHSFNTNQRVIKLALVSKNSDMTITVQVSTQGPLLNCSRGAARRPAAF